jgi:hypothetical protein
MFKILRRRLTAYFWNRNLLSGVENAGSLPYWKASLCAFVWAVPFRGLGRFSFASALFNLYFSSGRHAEATTPNTTYSFNGWSTGEIRSPAARRFAAGYSYVVTKAREAIQGLVIKHAST